MTCEVGKYRSLVHEAPECGKVDEVSIRLYDSLAGLCRYWSDILVGLCRIDLT